MPHSMDRFEAIQDLAQAVDSCYVPQAVPLPLNGLCHCAGTENFIKVKGNKSETIFFLREGYQA